jgi:hypothetical protein
VCSREEDEMSYLGEENEEAKCAERAEDRKL